MRANRESARPRAFVRDARLPEQALTAAPGRPRPHRHQGPAPPEDTGVVVSEEELDAESRKNVARWVSAHIIPVSLVRSPPVLLRSGRPTHSDDPDLLLAAAPHCAIARHVRDAAARQSRDRPDGRWPTGCARVGARDLGRRDTYHLSEGGQYEYGLCYRSRPLGVDLLDFLSLPGRQWRCVYD